MDQALDIVRETLMITLLISAPVLMVGLVVGLVISIIQAVTQIQEQTLSFVPKIVAMVAVVILLAPWIGVSLIEFSKRMFAP
jgi:flagellar biosynthetic protein FliQ